MEASIRKMRLLGGFPLPTGDSSKKGQACLVESFLTGRSKLIGTLSVLAPILFTVRSSQIPDLKGLAVEKLTQAFYKWVN